MVTYSVLFVPACCSVFLVKGKIAQDKQKNDGEDEADTFAGSVASEQIYLLREFVTSPSVQIPVV